MLIPLPAEYVVFEGATNVTLDCSGTGDPVPTIHWLRNGLVLPFPREQVGIWHLPLNFLQLPCCCMHYVVSRLS